jgi:hypothetical protein
MKIPFSPPYIDDDVKGAQSLCDSLRRYLRSLREEFLSHLDMIDLK